MPTRTRQMKESMPGRLTNIIVLSFTVALTVCLIGIGSSVAANSQTSKNKRGLAATASDRIKLPPASAPRQGSIPARTLSPPLSEGKGKGKEKERKKHARNHSRSTGRYASSSKKPSVRATLQAKPDLSYFGVLRQPQRYDPSQGHRTSVGAPNPQVGDLLHDHFQELDKNRDGVIDPLERVLGRLDMDRDLAGFRRQ